MLQKRHIPFRRDTSSFIGACALGNRDKCTTWFDSITFVQEVTLFRRDFFASGGEVRAWVGPLREETSRDGFYLRAEPNDSGVGVHGFQAELDTEGEAKEFKTAGLYETGGRAWVVNPDQKKVAEMIFK